MLSPSGVFRTQGIIYPSSMPPSHSCASDTTSRSSSIPSWNQFIFSEVQPGRSLVGGHAAQEGEEGYMPEATASEIKSSREQLTSTSTLLNPYPSTDLHLIVLILTSTT